MILLLPIELFLHTFPYLDSYLSPTTSETPQTKVLAEAIRPHIDIGFGKLTQKNHCSFLTSCNIIIESSFSSNLLAKMKKQKR